MISYEEWEQKFKPKVILKGSFTEFDTKTRNRPYYTEEEYKPHLDDLKERMKKK
jgi:hypothetical protein